MIFLQPLALLAVPLILVPWIIHWLNHRRHKPISWAAMHFLKKAQNYNKGLARIRYWMLLMLRTLAVAAIVLLVSRPIQTGYLASWIGTPSTCIIILDRSPSMQQVNSETGLSGMQRAIRQLEETLRTSGNESKCVLFTTPDLPAVELPDIGWLSEVASSSDIAASTDIPNTIAAALHYVRSQVSGPVDIWVVSDTRENDWQSSSSQWQSLRDQLGALPVCRLNLLCVDHPGAFNAAVTVKDVQRRQSDDKAELSLTLKIVQTSGTISQRIIPVTFDVAGARTTIEVELVGGETVLSGVKIPIDNDLQSGYGTARLATDSNMADNHFHFVFSKPNRNTAVVVSEDEMIGQVLQLSLDSRTDDDNSQDVLRISPNQIGNIQWLKTSMIVWQGEFPTGETDEQLNQLIERGGIVIFFPPLSNSTRTTSPTLVQSHSNSTESNSQSLRWSGWKTSLEAELTVDNWRTDGDLLRNSQANQALPIMDWRIKSYCEPIGLDLVSLAKLSDGKTLLARAPTSRGGRYYFASLPTDDCTNLLDEGISLYLMMQRALESAAFGVSDVQLSDAGSNPIKNFAEWIRRDSDQTLILDAERHLCSAVYSRENRFLAINRPESEDGSLLVSSETIQRLLEGAQYQIIGTPNSSSSSLASEIWHWFVIGLVFCLLVEAWITMPRGSNISKLADPVGSGGAAGAWAAKGQGR